MIDKGKSYTVDAVKGKLEAIFSEDGLQLVMVFGSTVSGKIHKKSDLDVAFLFDRPIDTVALTNKVINLLHTDNIDVVDLKRASPLLKYSIVKTGRLIYEKEVGLFNAFYSLAVRMYIDTQKLRDAQKSAIKHFLTARGLS